MMNIEWKNPNRGVYFEELNVGDTFENDGNFLYNKTQEITETPHKHWILRR